MQPHSNYPYPGYPYQRAQPRYSPSTRNAHRDLPVELPKERLSWFEKVMMAFAAIVLVLMIIGFWQAGSAGG